MADETEYKLENVKATAIAAEAIDDTFRHNTTDLISAGLEGKILAYSDQWFADAENLINPKKPIRMPGKMVFSGAWFDGWETRRHNTEPFDWVIIRLGVASGTVSGVEIDTAFFNGNQAPAISVEGIFLEDGDKEVVSWGGKRGKWETILGIQECGPSQRHAWKLDDEIIAQGKKYTHVRLNMYPDGGIARFRLYGRAVPVFPADVNAVFDLASARNGAVAIDCSDEHFGTMDNLLLPGRGKDMGDGWETSRSRTKNHVDWAVIRLGAPGHVQKVIVDTAFFRGNYPQKVKVQAINWAPLPGSSAKGPMIDSPNWVDIVPASKTGPDQEHEFTSSAPADKVFTHVKLVMIPDGGVKRIRVFGTRAV